MNKTDEELNLAEAMAKRYGVRMCDENGDTHGEELYCVGIDDIADIIREALADHIADTGKMIGCAYCDNPLFAGTKCNNCGRVTIAEPANTRSTSEYLEPVKQEPVAVISESAIGLVKLHSNGVSLPFGTQLYAAPVDSKAIREGRTKELMQLFLDPENQPTQFGTATLEYRQEEHKAIRAEALEEAAKVCDDMANNPMTGVLYSWKCAAAIRGLK